METISLMDCVLLTKIPSSTRNELRNRNGMK